MDSLTTRRTDDGSMLTVGQIGRRTIAASCDSRLPRCGAGVPVVLGLSLALLGACAAPASGTGHGGTGHDEDTAWSWPSAAWAQSRSAPQSSSAGAAARASQVTSTLPPIPEPPPAFAVLPFENRSPHRSLDWLRTAVPFVLAEKVEHNTELRPGYGPMVVPPGPMTGEADQVARFAGDRDASWVFTGWVQRPSWKLELSVTLWKITRRSKDPGPGTTETAGEGAAAPSVAASSSEGENPFREAKPGEPAVEPAREPAVTTTARAIGTFRRIGEFDEVHEMTGQAILQLCGEGNIALGADADTVVRAAVTRDLYAFTLFGRGLATLIGLDKAPSFKAAGRDLARAVLVDPTMAEAQRIAAELNLARRDSADRADRELRGKFLGLARGRLDRALELRPRYFAALAARAALAYERGELTDARKLYRSMLAMRPWDVPARQHLGEVLWRDGDADGALDELARVIARTPDHVGTRRVLALIYAARGEIRDLASELEQIIRLAPDDVQSRLDLAAAYSAVERTDDAIATYEAVLDRQPKNRSALKFLGDLHSRRGDTERAIAAYRRMRDAVPNDPRPYFLLGAAYLTKGDDRSAVAIYRQALRFEEPFWSNLPYVFNNLGAIEYRNGDYEKALFFLRRAVTKSPRNARFRHNYALALSASGDPDWALQHVLAGLRFEPDHVGLRYLLGVVRLRQGDRAGAQVAFAAALQRDPGHADARHNLELLSRDSR